MDTPYRVLKEIRGLGSAIAKNRLKKEGFLLNFDVSLLPKDKQSRMLIRSRKRGKAKDFRLTYRESLRQEFFESLSNYKVLRRRSGLPCRGQRSHTNGNTAFRLLKRGV